MNTPPIDPRPWKVFRSHRGIRVKKRDVIALGQSRRDEVFLGELDAGLTSHEAVLAARKLYGSASRPDAPTVAKAEAPVSPGKSEPWYGYYSAGGGARCRRSPIGELRSGETFVGTFSGDMSEEDVIGMIKSRQPKPLKPTYRRGPR